MSDPRPWEWLANAEACLFNYIVKSGSVDDDLLRALVLIREISKDFEVRVARVEIDKYEPTFN